MMSHPAPVRPQRRHLALRDLLTGALGWTGRAGERTAVDDGGLTRTLSPLAARGEAVALLCEAPLDSAVPDYSTRRRVHQRVARAFARPLTIFTDAAHSVLIWSWTGREPGGPLAYHEYSLYPDRLDAGRIRQLRAITLELEEEGAPPSAPAPAEAEVLGALVRALVRRDPRLGRPQGAPGQWVQELIEAGESPEALRRCWRVLTGGARGPGLAVLDPACGAGAFLLAALSALEPVYLACLERMQRWVDELDRTRPRSRPERLADFRAVLAHAEDARRFASPRHYVRHAIVRHNLYGADRDAEALETCRVRLRMRLAAPGITGAEEAERTGADDNLRLGDPRLGYSTLHEVERGLAAAARPVAEARRIAEEAETIERATRIVRRMGEEGAQGDRLPQARAALEGRRRLLCAELDGCLAREHGIDPARRAEYEGWIERRSPCHAFVEFHGVARRGGFALVRGGAP